MSKYLTTFMLFAFPLSAQATDTWTPLISAGIFDGVRTDLLTCVGGIVSCLLIVAGLGILYKVFN